MKNRCDILFVLSIPALLATSSCNYDISVPDNKNIEGCYYFRDNEYFELKKGNVILSNTILASYQRGRDESGTYVLFKPALHLKDTYNKREVLVSETILKNYLPTIVEMGNIEILMPLDPAGEAKVSLKSCPKSTSHYTG